MIGEKYTVNIGGYTVFPNKIICDTPLIPFVKAERRGVPYLARIVKERNFTEAMVRHLNKETDLINQYDCDHILKRIGDPIMTDEYVATFYENCNEGSLRTYMKGKEFSLNEIQDMIHQLIKALMIFNCENLCLGMITPDSIFVHKEKDQVIWKVGDLSFVKGIEDILTEEYNSCIYVAPEVMMDKKCDSKQDVYSMGVILKGIPKKESSPLLDQLIRRCTDTYYGTRIELNDVFGHPFLHRMGKFADGFSEKEFLGKGGFGCVYKAREKKSNVVYAVKYIVTNDLDLTEMAFEHPIENMNLVKLFREASSFYSFTAKKITKQYCANIVDHFFEKSTLYLVTELCTGGNLSNKIPTLKKCDPQIVYKLALDIGNAMVAMHHLGLAHRDLKPMNILFAKSKEGQEVAKLCDFGLAKRAALLLEEGKSDPAEGSIVAQNTTYAPPEASGHFAFDPRFDSWSLGVILYEMCTLKLPTKEQERAWKTKSITKEAFKGDFKKYDIKFIELIEKCLNKNFMERPTSIQIVEKLNLLIKKP